MYQSSSVRDVRAETFGPLKLIDADGRNVTPRGRKARALILYLICKPGHSESRRNLVTLLWGDRGEEQARQSLRQTLYELRPLMDGTPTLIGTDRLNVWIDATCLEIVASDPARSDSRAMMATDLDGVSPGFDQWLESARRDITAPSAGTTGNMSAPVVPGRRTPWFLGPPKVRRRLGIGLAALLMFASGIFAFGQMHKRNAHRLIVVQPLRVAPNDVPARRLSQDLASDLSRAVLGHDSRLEFTDGDGNPDKAAFNVSGKVASDGSELHAVMSISDGTDAAMLWSHDYTAPLSDLSGLRQQVSTSLASVLVCALGTRGVADTVDRQATSLYLEACSLHSGDQLQVAYLLRQVTARAPAFASGWADLAISLAFAADDADAQEAEAMRHEAEGAAQRALSLDPNEGNAFYAQALLHPGMDHWLAREHLIEAGLKVDPDNPQLHNLQARELAAIGRELDSIAENRRAVALDPLFPGKTAGLVRALSNAGMLAEANDVIKQMRETWPDSPYTWHARFTTAARIGDPREAEALLASPDASELGEDGIATWRAFLHARMSPTRSNVDRAIAALREQKQRDAAIDAQMISDLALLGRPGDALDLALRMPPQEESDFWFRSLLKPLRADPRFMMIARTQRLLSLWRATNVWPDFCRDGSVPYDFRRVADHLAPGHA